MAIDLTCSCGKRLRVTVEHAGTQGLCPACGNVLEISEQSVGVSGAARPLSKRRRAGGDRRLFQRFQVLSVAQ